MIKKTFILVFAILMFTCSSDSDEQNRKVYDITYAVTAVNGATINKIEYMDGNGVVLELTNVASPWTISFKSRAGLGLQAAAYGDVPYQGILTITARWKYEGGDIQGESESLPNDTQGSVINNGLVEISGRTLPD